MLGPGSIVDDRFRIVRVLGAGGMGTVYEAEHLGLGRQVALKILSAESANSSTLARFEREARAVAKLRGPHVVRVFDVDRLADGSAYMAMEYLDGHDLGCEIGDGGASISQLLEWTDQILLALAEAHAANVVHRDLKPENIFLDNDGPKKLVKLLDFGIAKLMDESPPESTVNSCIMGTPLYMSPEQLRGGPTDHRADLFSLGVIMYRVASGGKLPFVGGPVSAYVNSVLTTAPIPLATAASDVPAPFAAVIMRCLEREPAARYQSAKALADAFVEAGATETIRQDVQVPAVNETTLRRRRSRFLLALAATCAVCVFVAAIVTAVPPRRPVTAAASIIAATVPTVHRPPPLPPGTVSDVEAVPVAPRVPSSAQPRARATGGATTSTSPSASATPKRRAITDAPALL